MARRIRKETLKLTWRQSLFLRCLVRSKIDEMLEDGFGLEADADGMNQIDSDWLALIEIFKLNEEKT